MNVIVIMLDSFRQDHVSYYGWDGCPLKTPNLDAFSGEAVVFDNIYPENLPTLPVRTDLMTGQSGLINRSWRSLGETDVTASEIFRKEGYLTAIIADTYHLFKPGQNYHRGFDIFHWIRGAEYDNCRAGQLKHLRLEDHVNDKMDDHWKRIVLTALRNLDGRVTPEDFPCYQTVTKTLEVLEDARTAGKPIFLWLDTFQPHEPWCPPAKFDTFGDPDYDGAKIIMPPGGMAADWATDAEIRRIRSLYAGEAAYIDWCLGKLLTGMRQMGYMDDSVVVILSDHGHPLADHGKFLKGPDRMYSELLKVPFIVRLPGGDCGGERATDLGRFADLLPTLLDLTGLSGNAREMSGKSLRASLEGSGRSPYEATISGYFKALPRCLRNERYSYIAFGEGGDQLYDLTSDPRERTNIIADKTEVAEDLLGQFGAIYFASEHKPKGVQGTFEVADTSLG